MAMKGVLEQTLEQVLGAERAGRLFAVLQVPEALLD